MSDVAVIFLSSTMILSPNGNFLVVPLLHSVSDISARLYTYLMLFYTQTVYIYI
jgi:hypothetical protein